MCLLVHTFFELVANLERWCFACTDVDWHLCLRIDSLTSCSFTYFECTEGLNGNTVTLLKRFSDYTEHTVDGFVCLLICEAGLFFEFGNEFLLIHNNRLLCNRLVMCACNKRP